MRPAKARAIFHQAVIDAFAGAVCTAMAAGIPLIHGWEKPSRLASFDLAIVAQATVPPMGGENHVD